MTLKDRYNKQLNNDFVRNNEKIQSQDICAELSDRLDSLQKSVASLRTNITLKIQEQLLETLLNERERRLSSL